MVVEGGGTLVEAARVQRVVEPEPLVVEVMAEFVAEDEMNEADLKELEARLRAHVWHLAGEIGERNSLRYDRLEQARQYVERMFSEAGYEIRHDGYEVAGRVYRNVVAEQLGTSGGRKVLLVGAHYDTAPGTPGADDNASGVATLLEAARLLRHAAPPLTIRWAAFTLEEPPYFRTSLMGSRVHARKCRKEGEEITGMISLEMAGYYRTDAHSQHYPFPFMRCFYPDRGDFVAVAGDFRSRRLVRQVARLLSRTSAVPVVHVALPLVPGVSFSDNWSFWREGYPALMITDTAFFRNPHYHRSSDLPETLDYPQMAKLADGLARVLARWPPME